MQAEPAVFYYAGNIAFDISGISTKVSYENMWRSHFCSGDRARSYAVCLHALKHREKCQKTKKNINNKRLENYNRGVRDIIRSYKKGAMLGKEALE